MAHFLVDTIVTVVWKDEFIIAMRKPLWVQMLIHHLLSIIVWPMAVQGERGVFMVGYFMCTEITNILLNLRWLVAEGGTTGFIQTFCNVGLIVAYTVVRIVPIPWLFYLVRNHSLYPTGISLNRVPGGVLRGLEGLAVSYCNHADMRNYDDVTGLPNGLDCLRCPGRKHAHSNHVNAAAQLLDACAVCVEPLLV